MFGPELPPLLGFHRAALGGTQIGQKTGSIFDNFLPLGIKNLDGGELSKMVSPKERRNVEWLHCSYMVNGCFWFP